ncbi:MAG: class I SAM-dependent methyltransferase [Planctomycetota bacterium]
MSAARCPACTGSRLDPCFEKDGVPYARCASCGLLLGRPARNANLETALADYEPAYLEFLGPDADDAANFAQLLAPLGGREACRGWRALDVGAGGGKLVRWLAEGGVDAVGVEPAAALYRRFLAQEPERFVEGTVAAARARFGPASFDLVTVCDVIEHVTDPAEVVAQVAALLRPGGRLLLTTPDAESPLARLLGRRWHHVNRYHLALFGRRSLLALAARHGLRATHVAHTGRRRSLHYVAQYALDFVGSGGRAAPAVLRGLALPLNLGDVLSATFVRD